MSKADRVILGILGLAIGSIINKLLGGEALLSQFIGSAITAYIWTMFLLDWLKSIPEVYVENILLGILGIIAIKALIKLGLKGIIGLVFSLLVISIFIIGIGFLNQYLI